MFVNFQKKNVKKKSKLSVIIGIALDNILNHIYMVECIFDRACAMSIIVKFHTMFIGGYPGFKAARSKIKVFI